MHNWRRSISSELLRGYQQLRDSGTRDPSMFHRLAVETREILWFRENMWINILLKFSKTVTSSKCERWGLSKLFWLRWWLSRCQKASRQRSHVLTTRFALGDSTKAVNRKPSRLITSTRKHSMWSYESCSSLLTCWLCLQLSMSEKPQMYEGWRRLQELCFYLSMQTKRIVFYMNRPIKWKKTAISNWFNIFF